MWEFENVQPKTGQNIEMEHEQTNSIESVPFHKNK